MDRARYCLPDRSRNVRQVAIGSWQWMPRFELRRVTSDQ